MPLRHPGRWVATAIMLVLAAMFAHDVVTNPRWQWRVVVSYFWSPPIISGVERTLELTALVMVLGVVLGVILAVMRLSPNPVLTSAAWLYIWFFRGTPVYDNPVLVRDICPDADGQPRHSFRPRVPPLERQHARHPILGRVLSASGLTRLPTTQRS